MLDRLIALLFAMGVIAIPFDAINGVKALGELSSEVSFYIFALAIGLCVLKGASATLAGDIGAPAGRSDVRRVGAVLLGIVIVSTLWNAADISTARFHDRDGFAKLMTSAMVVIYGFALASLTCAAVPRRWYASLIVPIYISAALCIGFSALEALDRAGVSVPFYVTLNSVLHAGTDNDVQLWNGALNLKVVEGWDPRLRSVSFEPPAFGNFAGLAWPWLLSAALMTRSARKAFHFCMLALFTVLIIGSQARTGLLLLATNILSFGLLRFVFLPPNGRVQKTAARILGSALLLTAVFAIAIYAASFDTVTSEVADGTSVSDLSRLAYQVTALKIFATSPIVGVGLGQFAFKAASYMPAWGFLSPEISATLLYPDAPWPNTYSLYARIAAELGLVGVIGWLTIWVMLIVSVYRAALSYVGLGRPVPAIAYPIIITSVAILVAGATTDTFRTPMIWIALGAGACFSARSRRLTNEHSRPFVKHSLGSATGSPI